MTYEETAKRMAQAAAVVKLICGVANNAAWMVMLDGYDHARQCKAYRHDVRRNFRIAIKAMKDYEAKLVHSTENRMFHLADMSPGIRKKYGDISDREYYDFWQSTGFEAYAKTKPLITSLWNKYRLSLMRDGVEDATHVAWVMAAMAALELAVRMYGKAIEECVAGYSLPRRIVEHVFGQFSLAGVAKAWRKALVSLCPGTDDLEPSETDKRNIDMGLGQLCEAWENPDLLYGSMMDSVDEFAEIFRTKGEQKKAIRYLSEVRVETMKELEN